MRSGRLRTACGFFLPVHDQSRREHSRQGIPQYRQTFRSGPFRAVCERSPAARTVMPSQTFATAVPELRRATPRAVQTTPAGMLALGTDGKPPLSHDKRRRFRSARRLYRISRSPASDGRRPLFSSAAPDRQTGASHRSRRSYRYTESDCYRISYPARHGPSPDKS